MTEVKICGIRHQIHLDAALDAGADLVGLVLYERSPRNVTIAEAASLADHAHARGAYGVVTLLVNANDDLIDHVMREVRPDYLQLHGAETIARVIEIRGRTTARILKAVAVASRDDVAASMGYLQPGIADLLLFDAKPSDHAAALPGGNGLAFDWRILDDLKGKTPFALAGGLTPENVAGAIRLTHADIVDVSSGVETSPGEKDADLIRRFLQAAKAAKQN